MTKPLALLVYSKLMPGSRLVNRLQDIGYRVLTITDGKNLQQLAQTEKPMVLIIEISCQPDSLEPITALKAEPATAHIPVLAYSAEQNKQLQANAISAGVSLLAGSGAILDQLPQLLDQVLEL